MTYYSRYIKRVENNSRSALKDRSFARRLVKDYNSEKVYLINDMNNSIEAIIQTSRLQDKYDYKKISLKFSTEVKVGDIIYWEGDNTNWIIYLQRNTEKNYFLGEMKEANYKINWKDKNGVEYSQLGAFSRNFGNDLLKHDLYFDYLKENAQLLMTKTENANKLKIYDKFIIGNTVWEVTSTDMTTYKNIIIYSLKLAQWNKDEDTADLPHGQINNIFEIETNFDYLDKIKLDTKLKKSFLTKINGSFVSDNYNITVDNCQFENDVFTFNSLGEAKINIKSIKTNKEKEYIVTIEENPEIEEVYFIAGPDVVKATLSYKYKINRNINGNALLSLGEWSIDTKSATIVDSSNDSCMLKIGKYTNTFVLTYTNIAQEKVNKTIVIKNIFDTL